jgi:hypothetical protein
MNASDKRLRQAALSLHALHWRDREWLLRRLLPGVRAGLRALLRELRTLGIAPGVGVVGDALPEVQEGLALNAEDAAIIDAASASEILGAFASDAQQGLPAILLRLRAWRWRDAVWDGLTPLQRNRVSEAGPPDTRAMPVAWRDALLHALAQSLRAPTSERADRGEGARR